MRPCPLHFVLDAGDCVMPAIRLLRPVTMALALASLSLLLRQLLVVSIRLLFLSPRFALLLSVVEVFA
jgi:hypothetical protein